MGGCFALVARAAEGDHNVADAKPSPTEELARSATHHRIERCPALRPEPSGLRGGGSTAKQAAVDAKNEAERQKARAEEEAGRLQRAQEAHQRAVEQVKEA